MRYLEDIERFRGTEAVDGNGQTLEAFLDAYDARRYDCPGNTVDMLIFRRDGGQDGTPGRLRLLMIRRGNHPCIGALALPGGFVELKESLETAAARELEEETGLRGLPLIQLGTWGDWDRDPRWRIITTAYMTLIEEELPVQAGDDAADAFWVDVQLSEETAVPEQEQTQGTEGVSREHLSLRSEDGKLLGAARIRCTESKAGLLRERRCLLEQNEGISCDHALIIAEGVRRLRDLVPACF